MTTLRPLSGLALAAALSLGFASAALANPPGWRSAGADWSHSRAAPRLQERERSREGKVEVATFVAEGAAAQALGHGGIAVSTAKDGDPNSLEGAAYEAAVIDQLIAAGYDTIAQGDAQRQSAELSVTTRVLEPAEGERDPVSGETMIGISNRGSAMGMSLHIDLSEPKMALVSTRLEARIRDRESGEILWEGRADIATRTGDEDWPAQAIAIRLAEELFRRFPDPSGTPYALR